MKKLYVIDGVFLIRRLTGIERYACNMVQEMDKLVKPGRFILLIPERCENSLELKNIRIVRYGRFNGYLWEQTDLAFFIRKHRARGIFFSNAVPVFAARGVVFLHDISLKVNPGLFCTSLRGVLSVICWRLMYLAIVKSRAKIATVSEFSKSEIMRVYKVPEKRITVIRGAWNHMDGIEPDVGILERYGLKKGSYYYSMATIAPNKNVKWIIEAARQHKDQIFVVAGQNSFGICDDDMPENFILTGYVTDGEAKALMGNCRAFLFPTIYEGFGLPPMEALAVGAGGIIVSDTLCLKEIYGDIASYIDPYDYEHTCLDISDHTPEEIRDFLKGYSWSASARKLLSIMKRYRNDR